MYTWSECGRLKKKTSNVFINNLGSLISHYITDKSTHEGTRRHTHSHIKRKLCIFLCHRLWNRKSTNTSNLGHRGISRKDEPAAYEFLIAACLNFVPNWQWSVTHFNKERILSKLVKEAVTFIFLEKWEARDGKVRAHYLTTKLTQHFMRSETVVYCFNTSQPLAKCVWFCGSGHN